MGLMGLTKTVKAVGMTMAVEAVYDFQCGCPGLPIGTTKPPPMG